MGLVWNTLLESLELMSKSFNTFFFYFRLLIFISIVAVSCPIGWKPYKTSCYHVSTEDESWIDAMVSIVFARCKKFYISTFPDTSVKC